MEIATIGFTQSSAERFFERLRKADVRRLVDVRLHNVSQLAGFAKGKDLQYFLSQVLDATYEHDLSLAPTDALLSAYRREGKSWAWYEGEFRELLLSRGVPWSIDPAPYRTAKTALLCSEAGPSKCHRRIVAEVLAGAWNARVEHL